MNYSVVFRSVAERQWAEAYDRYRRVNPQIAIQFSNEVIAAIERIRQDPLMPREEFLGFRSVGLKRFPYRAYYKLKESRISISLIWHSKRSPRTMKRFLRRG